MSDTRNQLVEMGFSAGRIEAALRNTDGTLEAAIEWLEALQNRQSEGTTQNWASDAESAFGYERESRTSGSTGDDPASTTDASKEPTPEEREQKLQLLRERAAARKAEKEKNLEKERRENELIRKKNNQNSAQAKEDLKKRQALKEAAKRKQEQLEDKLAKQRIKDLIEADRRARLAQKTGSPIPAASAAPATSSTAKPAAPKTAPTDTKIRVRNIDDPPSAAKALSFPVDASLGFVAQKVAQELELPYASDDLVFMSTFPKKEYAFSEFGLSIKQAGLLSSSLVIKKA